MSAFICSDDHIRQLAIFAASPDAHSHYDTAVDPRHVPGCAAMHKAETHKLASYYADILYQENIRSVMHRYPADKRSDYRLRLAVSRIQVNAFKRVSAVELIKLCACLEYQSCETEDYKTTVAYDLLQQIKQAAIYALPGYQDASWTYEKAAAQAA